MGSHRTPRGNDLKPKNFFFLNYFSKRDNIYGDYVKIMKTIAVVAIVVVVGVFIGIIATADYGDFEENLVLIKNQILLEVHHKDVELF